MAYGHCIPKVQLIPVGTPVKGLSGAYKENNDFSQVFLCLSFIDVEKGFVVAPVQLCAKMSGECHGGIA